VIVREALMEPLRKCQSARQYVANTEGKYSPCVEYPNCPYCPIKLSDTPDHLAAAPCAHCHAVRMTLYEVPTDRLLVPVVEFADFQRALRRGHSSVAAAELQRFVSWTEEFGQDG